MATDGQNFVYVCVCVGGGGGGGGGNMANGWDGGNRWQYMGKTLWEEGGGGLTIWQMDEIEATDRQNLVEGRIDKLAMDGTEVVDGERWAKSCVCVCVCVCGGGGGVTDNMANE